ncbi:MAG: type I DNA topoisomerase [Alphaproteobacteria bacterium]|nr:type I DNA topoisomerase [Alphaproteobacteria bacterium]
MKLVVVESPAKAKTINKYLGKDYHVVPSYGHVRDLPAKDGSVLPDKDFEMSWEVDAKSAKRLKELADAAKTADRLILATDPDREGEAISWHVLEILKSKGALKGTPVERVVFNAITKSAVQEAMANPREIDQELVDAYLARRALDYLVGFTISPVLWRKLPGARSAGRVQSVALRLIVEREMEIEAFKAQEYWTIEVLCRSEGGQDFTTRLFVLDGAKLDKFGLPNEAAAMRALEKIRAASFKIAAVESKPGKRYPAPPFITSTLQQEAARKLGLSAKQTMQMAQRLYEGVEIKGETVGLITYMRTDGVDLAPEAVAELRAVIGREFGPRYLPGSPRMYKSKVRNAQEAHEAIRPTDAARRPADVAPYLDKGLAALYELIWKRTIACQMEAADIERTTIDVTSADNKITLRATGSVVLFDGFLKLYMEGRDDEEDEDGGRLPKVAVGETAARREEKAAQHFTEPPPRYSEASLVKKLEELGIGRPSTYASILSVLRERAYVRMEKNRFLPEDKGRLVTAFMTSFFKKYVEYDFTADLEERLDRVSDGKLGWRELLRDFWKDFTGAVANTSDLRVSQVLEAIDQILGPHIFPARADGVDPRSCPNCADGRLSLKLGRYGAFVGCSNYPNCNFTRPLNVQDGDSEAAKDRVLGIDPETQEEITLKSGRFGPYIQRGNGGENGEKPKRAGLPKGVDAAGVDLELALRLLSLPREIGIHPETQKPILAGLGRFGPYLSHDGAYANIEGFEDLFTIGINRAVTVLAEKKEKKGFQRRGPKVLRELGRHPQSEAVVNVLEGRYGPYVSDGTTNANIPRGADPSNVTLEEAVTLLEARAAAGPAKGKKAGAKPKSAGGKKTPPAAKTAKPAKAAAKSSKPAPKAKSSKPKKAAAS